MVRSVMAEHPEKASLPTRVTLDGIVIPVSALHLANAPSPIVSKPGSSVTVVKPAQLEKARSPILITLDGIAIPVSLLHPEKA